MWHFTFDVPSGILDRAPTEQDRAPIIRCARPTGWPTVANRVRPAFHTLGLAFAAGGLPLSGNCVTAHDSTKQTHRKVGLRMVAA